MKMKRLIALLLFCLVSPLAAQQSADESAAASATQNTALDSDIEALKKEVLTLNRDLFILALHSRLGATQDRRQKYR
jgi:hypothetical protein